MRCYKAHIPYQEKPEPQTKSHPRVPSLTDSLQTSTNAIRHDMSHETATCIRCQR